jgi:hypothetical protein
MMSREARGVTARVVRGKPAPAAVWLKLRQQREAAGAEERRIGLMYPEAHGRVSA